MSALQRPQPRPGVLAIDPYVPGKSTAPGVARVFKLSSNETPLGPSPKAVAAYRAVAEHLEDYPDGASTALREAIGRAFGLDPGRIICGAGSDDLLNLIADAYLCDGDEAIHTTHGFLVYPIATLGSGAKPIAAAEKNYTADVDAILAAVTERTKIVFLANPNNPTGTYVPFDEVKRLHGALPPHVLLVLDAAYAEYVRRNDYEAGIELVAPARTWSCAARSRKSTGWRRSGSAGSTARRMWSTPSTASADRSTSMRPRSRQGSPRSRMPRMWRRPARTTRNGWDG